MHSRCLLGVSCFCLIMSAPSPVFPRSLRILSPRVQSKGPIPDFGPDLDAAARDLTGREFVDLNSTPPGGNSCVPRAVKHPTTQRSLFWHSGLAQALIQPLAQVQICRTIRICERFPLSNRPGLRAADEEVAS